jgi:ferredoxin--NADP+ reductase
VRQIHLVGRRGPAQAKFTHKELRELCSLRGWQTVVEPEALDLNEESRAELAHPDHGNSARNLELLRRLEPAPAGAEKTLSLHFQRAPVALQGDGRLQRLTLEAQRLVGPAFQQRAAPAGRCLEIAAGLLFRSVGYRGSALPGLPFDERSGTLPHREGRVLAGPRVLPGWYVTGWIKRGPTGIIGTNRADSVETVARLLEDLTSLEAVKPGRAGLSSLLGARPRPVIGFEGWRAIEAVERQRGAERGKTAEKFVHIPDMLAAADGCLSGSAPDSARGAEPDRHADAPA